MLLQPAIYKRPDQTAGYDILLPCTDDACGPWLKLNLTQPYYDNGTVASSSSYGALAIGAISCGYSHPGKISTLLNGGLSKTSGSWGAITNNLGYFSGHYTEYTVSTGGQVSCSIPAAHTKVAVTLGVPVTVKPSIVVAVDGVTLETLAYGVPAVYKMDTRFYTLAPSASDRTLTVTCGATSGSQNLFTPIAVRSWNPNVLADPREASGGLHVGNSMIEYVANSSAGYQSTSMIHAPNVQASDCWRVVKPNTYEPIILCDPAGGTTYKWTALGHPHYSASDLKYVPATQPVLYVDGASIGNMIDATISVGKLYQADRIVIIQSGTTAGNVLKLYYTHSITKDGISTTASFAFQSGATVSTVYGTSLSGTLDAAAGLAEIVHTAEVPGVPTQYPTKVATSIRSGVVDVGVPGCPVLLRVTNVGPGAFTQFFSTVAKVYSSYDLIGIAPAAGVPWSFSSHVVPHLREPANGRVSGVGIKGSA